MVLSMALAKMDSSFRSNGTKAYFRNTKPEGMSELTWGRILLRVRTIQSTWLPPKDFAVECGMTPEQAEKWMAMPSRKPLILPD